MNNRVFEVFEFIDRLQAGHAMEILLGVAVVSILIDYYFATDTPAHFGYVSLALATFFITYRASVPPLWCCAAFVLAWLVLEMLHRLVFYRFLSNADSSVAVPTGEPD